MWLESTECITYVSTKFIDCSNAYVENKNYYYYTTHSLPIPSSSRYSSPNICQYGLQTMSTSVVQDGFWLGCSIAWKAIPKLTMKTARTRRNFNSSVSWKKQKVLIVWKSNRSNQKYTSWIKNHFKKQLWILFANSELTTAIMLEFDNSLWV